MLSPLAEDLANQSYSYPHYFYNKRRIRSLIDHYLAVEKLHDRLQDLPLQFQNPQPRPWKHIDWQAINREQIIGIDPEVFLSILIGAMDTEAPILRRELAQMHQQGVRISFIGDLSALPKSLQTEMEHSMAETLNNQAIHFTVAVNYGSRNEIIRACRQVAELVQRGELNSGQTHHVNKIL